MELYQIKKFFHSKGKHQQNIRQPTKWENRFADTSDKGIISKICKEFTKLNTHKKTNGPILKNGQKT